MPGAWAGKHEHYMPRKNAAARDFADERFNVRVRTYRLQNKSRRACPELVERGRLNFRPVQVRFFIWPTGQHTNHSQTHTSGLEPARELFSKISIEPKSAEMGAFPIATALMLCIRARL